MTKYVAIILRDGHIDHCLMRVFRHEDDANKYISKWFANDLFYWYDGKIDDVMEFVKNHDDVECQIEDGYICYKYYDAYIEYIVYPVEEV